MTETGLPSLSLDDQKLIESYLFKKILPTGVAGVIVGAVVSFAIQQSAQAAAKEAVASGLGTMTTTVVQESLKIDKARSKAEETVKKLEDALTSAHTAKEAAERAAEEASTASTLAKSTTGTLKTITKSAEESKNRVDTIRTEADQALTTVRTLEQDSDEFRKLLTQYREAVQKAENGLLSNDKRLHDLLSKLQLEASPIGTVIAWPCEADPPTGWLRCNGQTLMVSEYPALAAVLSATYGDAGAQMFRLPDFRGRFLRGVGGASSPIGVAQDDQLRSHEHKLSSSRVAVKSGSDGSAGGKNGTVSNGEFAQVGDVVGAAHGSETRPINYAVHWIIRARHTLNAQEGR